MWTIVASSIFLVMTFVDTALSEGNGTSLSNMMPRISEFKTSVHHILEGARIRNKRQMDDLDPSDYKLKFHSASPEDLPYLSDYSLTFWIPVNENNKRQILIGTAQGHIILFEMSAANDKTASIVAMSEVGDIAIKARAFTYHDNEWFAVLHYSSQNYYIRMYRRDRRGLETQQKIDLTGFSDMELVTMKGVHYLVAATYSTTTSQGFSYQATITLYNWAQTQFDEIAFRTAYGARSVVCWHLDGSLYIALAQETNDEGNFQVGSPIYLYNSKESKRLVLWEMLATFGPSKVQHFYVAGSHYIILIGRRDAVIYWWSSGQFLEWQSLMGTADATDVSILSLGDGEISIVIALKDQALFYTLDSSGYYVITLEMKFGSSLSSLQFMFSGKAYYALAREPQAYSIWKLTPASHYQPTILSLDALQQCLLNTQELLKHREEELKTLKEQTSLVWLTGSEQNITSKVIVKGKIISNQESSVEDVIIVRYAKVPDHSMGLVIAAVLEMSDLTDDTKRQLAGVVFKKTRQTIGGSKHFEEMVFIPSLKMEPIASEVVINDVGILRLQNYGLKKTGNQEFPNTTFVSDIYTETASVSSLNGMSPDDFLLLHGKQIVTGSLTFADASMSSASVNTLNSIPIEDIVVTSSRQDITGFKKFSVLNSDSIDVLGETNEVDLSSISKKIATIDNYNQFSGHMTFLNPVTINGNVFLTGKLNKMVDISRLVHQSVNRVSPQDLTGRYVFRGKQTINGDVLVGGLINKVSLDNLLTLSTDQEIYADMHFSAPLNIERDLVVDTVNGIDLSENVLTKLSPEQFVTGRKIFTKNMVADFVDMTDYVTLDGVDPSFLVQDLVQHNQGVVKQNLTVFKDVNVLGNLTVLGNINNIDISSLLFSVWLKSEPQEITLPVTASFLHFENDLDATHINNLNLGVDVVRSYTDEVIEAAKKFKFNTVFKTMKTGNGMVNGVNLAAFKAELDKYQNDKTVQGTKTMNSLMIHGNLRVTKVNELDVMDIMQPNAPQTVHGSVEFPAEITLIMGNTQLGSISFSVFNGENLQDYFQNAVTLSQHSRPLKNKHFKKLEATNLAIPLESTISGVSLHEVMKRVVTLNTHQVITARKSFASSLNFTELINVAALNGFKLSSYLAEIVLTDEVSGISNKQFLGDITTTNIFLQGWINGIKIEDMAENVFYKSADNEVTQHFVFEGDIDVGNLYATVLDGVKWVDLIFLQNDEFLESGWLLSKTFANRDIFVTGLVNGCDLSQISSSLYTNDTSQVINKNVHVHSILIVGNLRVKNAINKISLEALKNLVTITEDQVIDSDAVIEAKLIVDKLHIKDHEDSILSFIVNDAVRHSIPQEITGQKTFMKNLIVSVLAGGDVFASKVNGIDLENLEMTTLWKNGHQEVNGDKIFSSLLANVVIVQGFINTLKLPEDVVMIDTSEDITDITNFMSVVYMPMGIVVHGLVDGVDLNELIPKRVTLSGHQNISSELTFHDDVTMYDALTIDGTINEIVLDLVAKVKSSHPLQGYKVFIQNFYVSGSVTATSVNDYNVAELSSNILKYNEDDFLNQVQVFEKPIHAQNSLNAEWINNVPIRRLTEAFTSMMSNLKVVIQYLQDLSSSLQQKLVRQMLETQEKASKFAYFTLHQEIDLGPTSRILYGYNLEHSDSFFSHSLIVWTAQKRCVFMEKCCHLEFSHWLQVKKNGIVMADATAESGRYYPITKTPATGGKNFFIWTNAADFQPQWCSGQQTRMILASMDKSGLIEEFINVENAAVLSDVKSFMKGDLYAVAGFYFDPKRGHYGNTIVYVYNEKRYWTEWQILPSGGILSLDIISYTHDYKEEVLLALGTGMNTDPPSYSTVYKWNNNDRAFDFLQNIPSRYVTSTLWIRNGRDLMLSLAGVDYWPNKLVDCAELASGGQIDIYHYGEQLNWIQSISVGGVISTATFSLDDDIYLAAASSQHQTIYIFEWRGYAGFVRVQSISADVRHLSIYHINDDIYMTVASMSGPSKILKVARKGEQSEKEKNIPLTLLEQQDEVPKEQKIITGC